jgi:MoaA/NifB/PqqE/SkfB family radical SAM enzyme
MVVANFLVTPKCNIKCEFCLNVWKDERMEDAGQFFRGLDLFQSLRVIDRLSENGVEHLVLTGGEPLLHPHLAQLVEHAYGKGMAVIIQTNGVLISRQFLDRIAGKVTAIQVSLEGMEEEHNAITKSKNWKRVVENIHEVQKAKIRLMTNFTVVRKNIGCVEEYVRFLDAMGVDGANFTPLYPAGQAVANFSVLEPTDEEKLQFFRKLAILRKEVKMPLLVQAGIPHSFFEENLLDLPHARCGAMVSEFAVQPNGAVTMCPGSTKILGNIFQKSIDEMLGASKETHAVHNCEGCLLKEAVPLLLHSR